MHTQVRLSIHGSGFLLREEVEGGAPQALSCRITGVGNPPLTPVVVGAAQYPEGDDSTLTYAPALPQSPCRHCLGNQPPSAHPQYLISPVPGPCTSGATSALRSTWKTASRK